MKTRTIVSVLLVIITLAAVGSMSFARGTATSGGGDSVAAEFTSVGYQVVAILRTNPIENVDVNVIDRAVRTTLVETKDRLRLDDREVDAINFPAKKRILLSRDRWSKARMDLKSRIVLAFHEYLAIAGISDKNYELSHKLFEKEKVAWEVTCEPYSDLMEQLPPDMRVKIFMKASGVGDWFDAGLFVDGEEWLMPNGKPLTLVTLTNYEDQQGIGVIAVLGGLAPIYVRLPYTFFLDEKTPSLGTVKGLRSSIEEAFDSIELTCTYVKY